MSQSTLTISGLEDFIQLVLEDQALQDKLQACPDEESVIRVAVQLGEENGYDFTAEEVRQKIEEARQQKDVCFSLESVSSPTTAYF